MLGSEEHAGREDEDAVLEDEDAEEEEQEEDNGKAESEAQEEEPGRSEGAYVCDEGSSRTSREVASRLPFALACICPCCPKGGAGTSDASSASASGLFGWRCNAPRRSVAVKGARGPSSAPSSGAADYAFASNIGYYKLLHL